MAWKIKLLLHCWRVSFVNTRLFLILFPEISDIFPLDRIKCNTEKQFWWMPHECLTNAWPTPDQSRLTPNLSTTNPTKAQSMPDQHPNNTWSMADQSWLPLHQGQLIPHQCLTNQHLTNQHLTNAWPIPNQHPNNALPMQFLDEWQWLSESCTAKDSSLSSFEKWAKTYWREKLI